MALARPSFELRVTVARIARRAHVATVSGELDGTSAETLRARLAPLAAEDAANRLIVDLTGVLCVDASPVEVLGGTARLLRSHGGGMIVASDDPRLRSLLESAHLLEVLEFEPTLAGAVERVVVE